MTLRHGMRGRSAQAALIFFAALACTLLTLRLGFWQLDRAQQKLDLQAQIDTRSALPFLPQAELATMAAGATAQYQRRVRLRGNWLAAATVFLDNRQMHGRQGFFVLTPLLLQAEAGLAPSQSPLIWVQRGWVVRDNDDRTRLPEVPTPPGPVEVVGRVAPPPARLFEFASDESGPIRQNLDLDASARQLAHPVLPMTVLQTDDPLAGPDGLLRQWAVPTADVQTNYGYAFQWFALSCLVVGSYVWFQIIRPRWPKQRETV